MADGGRSQRIVTDRAKHRTDRRSHNAKTDHDADEIADRQKLIERPTGCEVDGGEAEVEARRRHPRQSVLTAGPLRERIELDEIEHLGDRDRDHGEVDAGATKRNQPDDIADCAGRDHADQQREDDVRKARSGKQVGGDKTAGAVEGRLTERQQPCEPEQDVEPDAEQPPYQDAVDRVRCESEIGQHERRRDQASSGQRLDQEGTLSQHRGPTFIRGPWCRADPAAGSPAQGS